MTTAALKTAIEEKLAALELDAEIQVSDPVYSKIAETVNGSGDDAADGKLTVTVTLNTTSASQAQEATKDYTITHSTT